MFAYPLKPQRQIPFKMNDKIKVVDCNFRNSWAHDTSPSFKVPLVCSGPINARYVGDRQNCTVNYQHILDFYCKTINLCLFQLLVTWSHRRITYSTAAENPPCAPDSFHTCVCVWNEVMFSSIRLLKRNDDRGIWKRINTPITWNEQKRYMI